MRQPLLPFLILALSDIPDSNALFIQPSSVRKLYPDLKLAIADQLGISYQGVAYDAGKEASYSGFALSLNAEFGMIDKVTFDKLQRAYSAWSETKSRVVWREGQTYSLLDFLPPILQAVSGLHFRSSRTLLRGLPSFIGGRVQRYTQQEVLLTSNCWGFTWEVLYQADNADTSALTISTADSTSAWRAFTGPGFDLVQSTRTQPKLLTESPSFRNRKLQPGDVLLIWHRNPTTTSGTDLYLDHVATCIDQDVYYEKSGSGDKVPFRVSTWDMITRNFPPSIFFWEWRRLVRNNPLSPSLYGAIPRLPPAAQRFGVETQVAPSRGVSDRWSTFLAAFPARFRQRFSLQTDVGDDGNVAGQTYTGILVLEDLVFDTLGRAKLPKTAFQPEWYSSMLQLLDR